MCGICSMNTTFHSECPLEGLGGVNRSQIDNTFTESDRDYANELSNNASTLGRISVGETVTSQLEVAFDEDWFRITLEAGERYQFDLEGVPGTNELTDPLLRLYRDGSQVAFNDDGGFGLDSRIEFTATASGTYYLSAEGFSTRSGEYRLTATELAPPPPPVEGGSLLPTIDWGSRVGPRRIEVYFAEAGEQFASYTSAGWTDYEIQQAMAALNEISSMIDVNFVQVSSPTNAEFRLVVQQSNFFFDGAMFPPGEQNAGVGVFARSANGWDGDGSGGLEQGGAGFQLLLHEFGHGLGLAHPHDTGGDSTVLNGVTATRGDYGDFDLNQGVFTNLSYNDGYQSETGALPSNDYGYTGTLSPIDLAVLQGGYGARANVNSGATTYELVSSNGEGTFYSGIYDTGGVDTITYDGSDNATIDLRAATLVYEEGGGGFVSYAEGIFGGFTIANGTVIENARGGDGEDVIQGNEIGNQLRGEGGDDEIFGGAGNDRLFGGAGVDTLRGGDGNDILDVGQSVGSSIQRAFGQAGDDTYLYGTETGSLFINVLGEQDDDGNDTIIFSDLSESDLIGGVREFTNTNGTALEVSWDDGTSDGFLRIANLGQNIENYEFGDASYSAILTADGSGVARSNSPDWVVTRGGQGADLILGGDGRDSVYGGGGNDFLNVGGNNSESLQLAYGQAGDDTYLYGTESGSLLINFAAEGADEGNDTLMLSDLSQFDLDVNVVEYSNANGATLELAWNDGVNDGFVRVANLGENIENYEFTNATYSAIVTAEGSGIPRTSDPDWVVTRGGQNADWIVGGDGRDSIYGGGGNDFLDVGENDGNALQLAYGQAGDDTYLYGTEAGSLFINYVGETADGGNDTLRFSDLSELDLAANVIEYSNANGSTLQLAWNDGINDGSARIANLGENIESYEFDGTSYSAILTADGSGTVVSNNPSLTETRGSRDAELILGGDGSDYIYGGGGNDFLNVGGNDHGTLQRAFGQSGDDTYVYGTEVGSLFINASAERAQDGDDTIVFSDISETDLVGGVFEYSNVNGTALEVSWDDGTNDGFLRIANLGENIESYEFSNATYSAILTADGSGTARSNFIDTRGSSDADVILGGEGRDFVYGGGGDDFLSVGGHDSNALQYAFGQSGDDTYSYSTESGRLFINAAAETAGSGTDTLVFTDLALSDISASTVLLSGSNGTALQLAWDDGSEDGFVRIANEGRYIESFEFADGSVAEWDDFL